jgi:hypothetical protein
LVLSSIDKPVVSNRRIAADTDSFLIFDRVRIWSRIAGSILTATYVSNDW